MFERKPLIALTAGDPAGIGPEIAVRVATDPEMLKIADFAVYGDPEPLAEASRRFANSAHLEVVPCGGLRFSEIEIGKPSALCGLAAYNAVVAATRDAIDGKVSALVTAPVCKASVNMAGIKFSGHTELVAELCGTEDFAMMQSSGNLRVVFVSTHVPLSKAHEYLSLERLISCTSLLRTAIVEEGIRNPLIAFAAFNPHAGEDGHMGSEELDIVIPAICELRKRGFRLEGPFPPDTLFIEKTLRRFDGIVSMYHDQGHIPFKMLAFESGVNSTLGIPIIRTSVDHGTAFEIAWKGLANTGSLEAAVRVAAKRTKSRSCIL